MSNTIQTALRIQSTTHTGGAPLLEEGTYHAVWSGWVVTIIQGSHTYNLNVNQGIRGRRECRATILGFTVLLHD